MRYIKTFESKKKNKNLVELVNYPQGNIINVTQEEFDELKYVEDPETEDNLIVWDDEVDYHHGQTVGQWRFDNYYEEQIEEWLKCFRDPIYRDAKKYNL